MGFFTDIIADSHYAPRPVRHLAPAMPSLIPEPDDASAGTAHPGANQAQAIRKTAASPRLQPDINSEEDERPSPVSPPAAAPSTGTANTPPTSQPQPAASVQRGKIPPAPPIGQSVPLPVTQGAGPTPAIQRKPVGSPPSTRPVSALSHKDAAPAKPTRAATRRTTTDSKTPGAEHAGMAPQQSPKGMGAPSSHAIQPSSPSADLSHPLESGMNLAPKTAQGPGDEAPNAQQAISTPLTVSAGPVKAGPVTPHPVPAATRQGVPINASTGSPATNVPPQIRIGQINVLVEGPPQSKAGPPSDHSDDGAASRNFLRSL